VILLEILWWTGLGWFGAWAALPLALVPLVGPVAGVAAWVVLAPWTALIGMAGLHRLLPGCEPGRYRMFADRGAVRWALTGWAPSVYLTVFQPLCFLSPAFQRIALRAFGARLGPGAKVTSRTSIREPFLLRLGRGAFVGEFAHLVCAYQPRAGMLHVDTIEIGDDVLVGAHAVVAAGTRIGDRAVIEFGVAIAAHVTVGADARIGASTQLFNGARIGDGAVVGKGCLILAGAVVPPGVRVPDGAVWKAERGAEAVA